MTTLASTVADYAGLKPYRLINLSTTLPVCSYLEAYIDGVVNPVLLRRLAFRDGGVQNHAGTDIFLVEPHALAPYLPEPACREVDPDCLGLYFHSEPHTRRPAIWVSPEKIMVAAAGLRKKDPTVFPPLEELYPLMLSKVILHELGHALMDDAIARPAHHDWKEVIAEAAMTATHVNWANRLAPLPATSAPLLIDDKTRIFMEESLANAFALVHCFALSQRTSLLAFVALQSYPYAVASAWQLPAPALLATMESWRQYKQRCMSGQDPLPESCHQLVNDTVEALASFQPQRLPLDFISAGGGG